MSASLLGRMQSLLRSTGDFLRQEPALAVCGAHLQAPRLHVASPLASPANVLLRLSSGLSLPSVESLVAAGAKASVGTEHLPHAPLRQFGELAAADLERFRAMAAADGSTLGQDGGMITDEAQLSHYNMCAAVAPGLASCAFAAGIAPILSVRHGKMGRVRRLVVCRS